MNDAKKQLLSCIVPVYNEEKNLSPLYDRLRPIFAASQQYEWEIIFVNDGSTDGSGNMLRMLTAKDARIRVIEFTRNFGKEAATSAGLAAARGDAAILFDADLQHPIERLPEFIRAWEKGAEVVVGVRDQKRGGGFIKNAGGKLFYAIMRSISDAPLVPYATDFRLLDRAVIDAFNRFTERNRMTRNLVDWLGFRTVTISFATPARGSGRSHYSLGKLVRLALSAFVANSLFPLKIAGYLGIFITFLSAPLGFFIFIEKYLLNDPWALNFTGTAMLAVFNLFLIGIVLMCLGLIAYYIASIHGEVGNRPLYVVREKKK